MRTSTSTRTRTPPPLSGTWSASSPSVLDDVLAAVEVRSGTAARITVEPGGRAPFAAGVITMVYLLAGDITPDPTAATGCELDIADGSSVATAGPLTLTGGDAFLTMGSRPIVSESTAGADLVGVELDLGDSAAALATLPGLVLVTGFSEQEPEAALLAGTLGPPEEPDCALRPGQAVICRQMARTVLMSLVRAFANSGCVPDGWPSRTSDPFLERAIDAIHAEPGRDWTVETLARMSAMARSTFSERFRVELGQSPASYVAEVRMAAAKTMLSAGHSVSATALELGYRSDAGFSRAFRRHTGVLPSAWHTVGLRV